jgi:hypothetical protein
MSKKLILVLVMGFVLCKFNLAEASVVINEIMYAPAIGDSEWIEIFNSGNDSVDVSDWRFFNNKDDSAPFRLQKGSAVLPAGGYAIITSTSDWSSFSGTVFSSSLFSLPNDSSKYNTYKAISDSNKQNINSVTYTTSPDTTDTGNSLQLINGEWKSAVRTPGAQNQNSLPASSASVGSLILGGLVNDTSTSPPSTTTAKTKIAEEPKIKTQISAKTQGFAGIPISFQGEALGYQGEQMHFGKYFWNFGDGDSKEVNTNDNLKFTHAYFYPGEYTVSLDYFQNHYSDIPDASSLVTIKIIPADILISRVGDEKDFFIELKNNTDYNADISNWILESNTKSFSIPRNTILGTKKEIIISPKISNFSIEEKNTLKLLAPDKEVVYDYVSSFVPAPVIVKQDPTIVDKRPTSVVPVISVNSDKQIPINNLVASVNMSDVASNDGRGNSNNTIIFISSFIFIGISAYAVYFIRQKRVIPQAGNDFEILDE